MKINNLHHNVSKIETNHRNAFGIIQNVLMKNVNYTTSNQNKNAKILCLFVLQMALIV